MSSLFKSRRRRRSSPDDGGDADPGSGSGSGGKILRRRPAAEPPSPYRRPPPPALPAPPSESGWISGIFYNAGRIISSVFGSSQSDDESVSGSSEDEDINTSAEELSPSNKRRKEQELIRDHREASAAIVPSSESKLAIERLLKQETFSRDECLRLVEILQSRVVDQHNELQPHFSAALDSSSPGYFALRTPTPDLRATAVKEAKKYLEEKKLSSSRSNLDYGPCTLNTDNLPNDIEDDQGSPVDMAKSYMQSLPPWQSPPFSSIGFRTPPHSGTHLYKDHIPVSTGHSLPSSKVLKRSYLSNEPWHTPEEIRRVRTKTTNYLSESSNGELIPSTSLSDHKASLISSAAERRVAEDNHTNGALSLLDENANEGKHSKETGISTCVTVVSKLSEALDVGQLTNESRMPTSLLPSQADLGSKTNLSDPNTPILCENQDVDKPPATTEVTNSSSHPDESLALPSKPMEHADSRPQEGNWQLLKETEELCHDIAANGPPAENGVVLRSWIQGLSLTPKSSNISEPPAHFHEGPSELPSEDFVDVPVHAADSIEPVLTETSPSTSRRGKKAAVRSRRGARGRGRLK